MGGLLGLSVLCALGVVVVGLLLIDEWLGPLASGAAWCTVGAACCLLIASLAWTYRSVPILAAAAAACAMPCVAREVCCKDKRVASPGLGFWIGWYRSGESGRS